MTTVLFEYAVACYRCYVVLFDWKDIIDLICIRTVSVMCCMLNVWTPTLSVCQYERAMIVVTHG